jgi:hypothetical protein
MLDKNEMWNYTLNMALASYLNKRPDRQVKNMARRYRKITLNPVNRKTLKTISGSSQPAMVVRLAYEDLIS